MTQHITEQEEISIKKTLMQFIKDNFVFEGSEEAVREMLLDKTVALFEIVMTIADKTAESEGGSDMGGMGAGVR